jgi:pilus assembly protein CpaE
MFLPEHSRKIKPSSMNELPDTTRSNVLALALIVPDIKRRRALAMAMAGSRATIVREFGEYPAAGGPDELGQLNCDVVVVDLDDDTTRAIGLIEDICSSHPSLTVMAISARNDSNLLRRSMHAGAREFLVEPLLPETVQEAMARAFARRPQQKKAGGKMLVFVATKGGVGVTTLTANFALALTGESAARVAVVDMDFQLGEIALGLGLTATFSVVDALRNIDRLDREFLSTMLIRHSSGLSVLASPEEYSFFQMSAQESVTRLFRVLREEFDYVVVDAGACQGHFQEALFEMADRVYIVTELTLPALRNAHRLISHLSAGDGSRRTDVVVNRFNSRNGDIDEASAVKAIGRAISWRIPNAYAAARAAQDNGVPLALQNSPITKTLVQMARVACGKPVRPEKKAGGAFSFFGSKTLAETVEI